MKKIFTRSVSYSLIIMLTITFTHSIAAQTVNGILDFGNPADNTVLLNTAGSKTITADGAAATGGFGIIRQGSTGGSFTLLNPGTAIGALGEFRIVAPTTTSINSAGIRNTEYGTASQLTTISFDAYFSGGTNGSFVFNAGNGTTFTNNTVPFTGAESFIVLTFSYGAGNTITTTNRANAANTALANFTFAQNTAYSIRIVGNNTAAAVNYGSGQSVASGTFDLYVNGILVENDLAKAGLPTGTNINAFRYYGQSSTTPANNSAALNLDNVAWSGEVPPVVAATPTVTVNPTNLTFPNTTVGSTSAEQTYTISGSNLTGDITITAPAGFEISTVSGSGFGSQIVLLNRAGSVAAATIYVRFKPTSATAFSGNITNASPGAATQNVAVSGTGAAAANTPPTISDIPNQTGTVGTPQSISFTVADAETLSGAKVTATSSNTSVAPNPTVNYTSGSTSGSLSITPSAAGTTTVTVTITDAGGASSFDTFNLTVSAAATAPTITSADNARFTVGVASSFTVTTTGNPAPAVTLTGALPSGVTFNDNGNGTATIAGTAAAGTAGTYNLKITATNSAGNQSQAFTLIVNPAGDTTPPTVNSIKRASANPTASGSTVSFTVSFSEAVTSVDATDFALTTTGVSGATIAGVSGSGATYTVNVNVGTGSGTVRLDVNDNDSIIDAANNPLGGNGEGNGSFTGGETYTVNQPPAPGMIEFSSATFTGSETGTNATLTVRRTGGSSGTISATVTYTDGSATGGSSCAAAAGVDYVFNTATVNFADGDTADKIINIIVCDDSIVDASETFAVTLGGSSAAGQTTATVTITDNDSTASTVTLGAPRCQGLAPVPLRGNTARNALMCFSLSSNNGAQFTGLIVRFSSNPSTKYANPKLYSSIDTDYSTQGDNTLIATGTVDTEKFTFTGFTALKENALEKALNPNLAQTPINFFVAADVLPTVDSNTDASTPTVSAGDITINPPTTVTGNTVSSPAQITFAPAVLPTAAAVNVGGRVVDSKNRGIWRAAVKMTDGAGGIRTVYTNAAGYFRFAAVEVGQTLIFSAKAKGYDFAQPTQVISLTEENTSINFRAY